MDRINIESLILFRNVGADPVVRIAVKLDERLNRNSPTDVEYEDLATDYYNTQRLLMNSNKTFGVEGSFWEAYICKLVAESENPFSLGSETGILNIRFNKMAEHECYVLKRLLGIDWVVISEYYSGIYNCVCNFRSEPGADGFSLDRTAVKDSLLDPDIKVSTEKLSKYYSENSCGIFEAHDVFIWEGELRTVHDYDKITFEDLIGYEHQKALLIDNTKKFLAGSRSNNVILYGDKGTGKSSSVKATVNMLKKQGLKLINVPKNRIIDINKIMGLVASRGSKFIIFIDDLSFEDTELEYKYFKSILEGGVEVQPKNVLVYVTSNRRNLVKETWKDREGNSSEIHVNDGIQERLSLADRFGLSIAFPAPGKREFIEIVRGIAEMERITIDDSTLLHEANIWDMRQSGRSGRSARQFINYISGGDGWEK